MIIALLCGLLSGATCGIIGVYIVGMRIPFIGVCVAHAALAGAVFGEILGLESRFTLLPALIFASLTSLFLGSTPKCLKMDDNALMNIIFSASMGIAFLGMGILPAVGKSTADAMSLLWGNIAFCGVADCYILAVALVAAIVYATLFHKELTAILLSRELAVTTGMPVKLVWGLFLLLTAVVFTVNFQTVGGLMVYSLVSNSAIVAFTFTRGVKRATIWSAIVGAIVTAIGFGISFATDFPSGAVIVLLSSLVAIVATICKNRQRLQCVR